jgi:NAD(P)-dependent dehydrogenase (short-subunit alcohol dehydrogenase family)
VRRAAGAITMNPCRAFLSHTPEELCRDPARLIAWLATDEAGWITGEVISSEGGFRR